MKLIDYIIIACSILVIISFSCAGAIAFYNIQFSTFFVDVFFYSVVVFYFVIAGWGLHLVWKMDKENKKKRKEQ